MPDQKTRPMPTVLESIPISRDLKRYYWKKYLHLRQHNGAQYAANVFKKLREIIMSYVSQDDRMAFREVYIASCPVRQNGWLRQLFLYADTDPQYVFQFLRLYLCEDEPVVSVREAAEKQHAVLEAAEPTDYVPGVMLSWLHFVAIRSKAVKRILLVLRHQGDRKYRKAWKNLMERDNPFVLIKDTKFRIPCDALGLILKLWVSEKFTEGDILRYHSKWRRIMLPIGDFGNTWAKDKVSEMIPTRGYYCDTEHGADLPRDYAWDQEPDSFEMDLSGFLSNLCYVEPHCDLLLWDALPEELWELSAELNPIDEEYYTVGSIHHIPKKGTVVRRSIAAPNRFLQAGLLPMRDFLRNIARAMPRNCQFDQEKLDREIYSHLMSDYAGCVDLSQATDWLPLSWFEEIQTVFGRYWSSGYDPTKDKRMNENRYLLEQSFQLFGWISREKWLNDPFIDRWKRGQPLGTLPSFEILTITHVVLLESLSCDLGYLSSPYGVLGDDTVFFKEDLRTCYIAVMQEAGSPLSLHKSYSGRMVEFAGKIFVKKQKIAHSPKPVYLGWSNLFDYQRAAKLSISYSNLPSKVRKRLVKLLEKEGLPGNHLAGVLYAAMQIVADVPISQIPKGTAEFLRSYGFSEAEDQSEPEVENPVYEPSEYYSLFDTIIHPGGHDSATSRAVSNMERDRLRTLAKKRRKHEKWFELKYRPVETDVIAERCLRHYRAEGASRLHTDATTGEIQSDPGALSAFWTDWREIPDTSNED